MFSRTSFLFWCWSRNVSKDFFMRGISEHFSSASIKISGTCIPGLTMHSLNHMQIKHYDRFCALPWWIDVCGVCGLSVSLVHIRHRETLWDNTKSLFVSLEDFQGFYNHQFEASGFWYLVIHVELETADWSFYFFYTFHCHVESEEKIDTTLQWSLHMELYPRENYLRSA